MNYNKVFVRFSKIPIKTAFYKLFEKVARFLMAEKSFAVFFF